MEKTTEEKVIIRGRSYLKTDPNITIDFVTGAYIHIEDDYIYSFYTPDKLEFNLNNELLDIKTKISRTTSKASLNTLVRVVVYVCFNRERTKDFYFINNEALEAWRIANNLVYGTTLDSYLFHASTLKFDKRVPYYFNNLSSRYSLLRSLNYYLGDVKTETKEYKELIPIILKEEEELGSCTKTCLAFEGLDYTFGVELETVSGVFSDYTSVFKDLNVSSVFDGSLRDIDQSGPWGAEYVTGVLVGDAGLKQLSKITKVLNTKCTVDERTAFHVHIGSLEWNSQDILFAYILGCMIEEEVFTLFPRSRKESAYCKALIPLSAPRLNKLANNKKLSKIAYKKLVKQLYNQLFNIVGMKGAPGKNYNKNSCHPKGKHGGYDRDTDHRYSWLNFTNIIFNQRGSLDSKTIEFRCHSGTLSYTKIHNWLKFCMAFTEFVNSQKQTILNAVHSGTPISVNDIITTIYPKTGHKLVEYMETRKNIFSLSTNESHDYQQDLTTINNLKDIICV